MRITRWAEYGILCCLYLARKHTAGSDTHNNESDTTTVGAAEISETQSIPLQYTQQILHRLRKGGIIRSVRGPHGGFILAHPPGEINLRQILSATDGDTFEVICETDPVYPHLCNTEHECGLRPVWHDLKDKINKALESYTLLTIMNSPSFSTGSTMQSGRLPQNAELVQGPRANIKNLHVGGTES